MSFVVDPRTLSFRKAKEQLNNYIKSKPNYSAWEDFFEGSAGQTLVELIAGMLLYKQYNAVVARRESYLEYAQNVSSNRAIANGLGYDSFRGGNTRFELTFTPSSNKTYQYLEVVGSFNDYDLISLENKTVSSGAEDTLLVTFGTVEESSLVAESPDLAVFRFKDEDVSEYLSFFVDNQEVAYETNYLSLASGQWVLVTNGYGAVNAYSLNEEDPSNPGYTVCNQPLYTTGTELKINYVTLVNEDNIDFSDLADDVVFYDDDPTSISIFSLKAEPESVDSIKINAPLYYETQYVIRGRNDYRKVVRTLNDRFVDVIARDFSPTVVEVSYLTNEQTPLTDAELLDLTEKLLTYRPLGVQPAIITPPLRSSISIDIDILLTGVTSEDFTDIIEGALSSWDLKFPKTLDFSDIEYYIEENSNLIKIARATPSTEFWQANQPYERITFVTPTSGGVCGLAYVQCSPCASSGSTEPLWPTETIYEEDTGQFTSVTYTVLNVLDGLRKLSIYVYEDGSESTVYGIDDGAGNIVGPNISGTVNYETGEITVESLNNPSTGNIFVKYSHEYTIVDNGIVWELVRDERCDTPMWEPNTCYDLCSPSIVKPTGMCSSIYSYRLKHPAKYSGIIEPTWPEEAGVTVQDNGLVWLCAEKVGTPDVWNPSTIYGSGQTVVPTTDNGYMYVCVNYTYLSGSSEPIWANVEGDTVQDGEVCWKAVKTTNLKLDLCWNEYLDVTSTVNVSINTTSINKCGR